MQEIKGKYTKATIFADTIEEGVYQQVYDIVNCPAFAGQKVVCMPDVHVGSSGPCGLVAMIGDYVCPEHIGVDIGCSVSMMILDRKIPEDKYVDFEHKVRMAVPSGSTLNEKVVIDEKDFFRFLTTGFNRYKSWWPNMLDKLPDKVTELWISEQLKRLRVEPAIFYKSLGTIGGGNHFIEYDEEKEGGLAGITLHFGSRNFGLKVCEFWTNRAKVAFTKKEIDEFLKEYKEGYKKLHKNMKNFKEDFNTYLETKKEGHIQGYLRNDAMKGYLCDMCFAQLYAEYNHMTVQARIKDILKIYGIKVERVITSVHNYLDFSDWTLRKSAISAHEGEEILVPFNMRDGIAICEGIGNPDWLYSCSHGAGRVMSRGKAKHNISLEEFRESMKGIYSTSVGESTIDESPMAYKDTEEIKTLIQETCRIKHYLLPRINIKACSKSKDEDNE